MSRKGKFRLTLVFTSPADQVSEADRIFESHAKWMVESHPRDGELALLSYDVSKGAEFSNPLDPSTPPTGNTIYVVNEIYESMAGVQNHWKLGQETWADFGAMMEWAGKCSVVVHHGTPIVHSL